MREIKFRGKRIDDNEWIEGQLLYFKDSVGKKNMARIAGGCEWNNETDWYSLCNIHRVKEETIGQYTGIKDKNGKEIYEGDIVKITHRGETDIGKIIYEYNGFTVDVINMSKPYGRIKLEMLERFIEVIGNIYDNKELLER